MSSNAPTRVVGIDFSGSREPGRNIWLTTGTVDADGALDIEEIRPAADEFDAEGRDSILKELQSFILDQGDATIGLDFPFGLPAETTAAGSWLDGLEDIRDRLEGRDIEAFPDAFPDSDTRKRETDFRFAGQSPFSPQIKYQVFYGLRDLLAPLVLDEGVRVLPMLSDRDGEPTLVEVYPAATFGRLCCFRTGYKSHDAAEARRTTNLQTLQAAYNISLEAEEVVVQSDDALDSLCAACAASRAETYDWPSDDPVEGAICP